MNNDFISIAKILNFHGIKGEVKLGFTKGSEERIKHLKKVFILKDAAGSDISIELHVSSVRFHKNTAIIKFSEFSSINDMLPFKGCDIFVLKSEIEESLDEDEYLITDLIGTEVYDEDGARIGEVSGIGGNAANDILEIIDANSRKHLVPFVKAIVPVVDLKNKRIVINNIEGLIN